MNLTDKDLVDYGRLRSSGMSKEEAMEKISLAKKIDKITGMDKREKSEGGKVSHHPKQKLNYVRDMGFNENFIGRLG